MYWNLKAWNLASGTRPKNIACFVTEKQTFKRWRNKPSGDNTGHLQQSHHRTLLPETWLRSQLGADYGRVRSRLRHGFSNGTCEGSSQFHSHIWLGYCRSVWDRMFPASRGKVPSARSGSSVERTPPMVQRTIGQSWSNCIRARLYDSIWTAHDTYRKICQHNFCALGQNFVQI